MGLGKECPVFELRRLAFAHDPDPAFLQGFQIPNQDAFKLGAGVRILWNLSHLFESQSQVALEDFLAERLRAAEETVGQLLHFPNAQRSSAHRTHKRIDVPGFDTVHRHELAHQIHVGIDRECARQKQISNLGTHPGQKPKAHAHPRLAALEFLSDLAHAHAIRFLELVNKPGLLQKAERFFVRVPQQVRDGGDFIRAQRKERRPWEVKFESATIPLEAIE